MLPILQQSLNSTASGPLNVAPNSVVFASIHTPDSFVIPSLYIDAPQGVNIADGNFHSPSANFMTRAVYFQQMITNRRHELLMHSMSTAGKSQPLPSTSIPVGSQVLIPWPQDRQPSTLHPFRRGPYIVTKVDGNVLTLLHAVSPPLPADQPETIRWSRHAQIFSLDTALARAPLDPAAVHSAAGTPSQQTISCVLSFTLLPAYNTPSHSQDRFHVRHQVYTCRLFSWPRVPQDDTVCQRDSLYEDICHTFAFDSFIASCPCLTGHTPVASMPANWDPRAPTRSRRPAHDPVIDAERPFPTIDADD